MTLHLLLTPTFSQYLLKYPLKDYSYNLIFFFSIVWWLSEEVGFSWVANCKTFIIAKWFVDFFFFFNYMNLLYTKFMKSSYIYSHIESLPTHLWRYISNKIWIVWNYIYVKKIIQTATKSNSSAINNIFIR